MESLEFCNTSIYKKLYTVVNYINKKKYLFIKSNINTLPIITKLKSNKDLSKEEYNVVIKVKTLNKEDTIYITGNQDNLGNWNPNKIKMDRISDFEREINLKLKSPAQFKFTRGNWETEAEVIGTYGNIMIKPEKQSNFEFEIEKYFDN